MLLLFVKNLAMFWSFFAPPVNASLIRSKSSSILFLFYYLYGLEAGLLAPPVYFPLGLNLLIFFSIARSRSINYKS